MGQRHCSLPVPPPRADALTWNPGYPHAGIRISQQSVPVPIHKVWRPSRSQILLRMKKNLRFARAVLLCGGAETACQLGAPEIPWVSLWPELERGDGWERCSISGAHEPPRNFLFLAPDEPRWSLNWDLSMSPIDTNPAPSHHAC